MSDDLISRKALMEGRVENDPVRIAAMCASTAFDKEKVIDELEKLAGIARLSGDYNKNCVINAALRIIKQGGLN